MLKNLIPIADVTNYFKHKVADINYYQLLNLEPDAKEKDIVQNYRQVALEQHPDKGGDVEQFQKLTEAYNVLRNRKTRRIYDVEGISGLKFIGAELRGPAKFVKYIKYKAHDYQSTLRWITVFLVLLVAFLMTVELCISLGIASFQNPSLSNQKTPVQMQDAACLVNATNTSRLEEMDELLSRNTALEDPDKREMFEKALATFEKEMNEKLQLSERKFDRYSQEMNEKLQLSERKFDRYSQEMNEKRQLSERKLDRYSQEMNEKLQLSERKFDRYSQEINEKFDAFERNLRESFEEQMKEKLKIQEEAVILRQEVQFNIRFESFAQDLRKDFENKYLHLQRTAIQGRHEPLYAEIDDYLINLPENAREDYLIEITKVSQKYKKSQ